MVSHQRINLSKEKAYRDYIQENTKFPSVSLEAIDTLSFKLNGNKNGPLNFAFVIL